MCPPDTKKSTRPTSILLSHGHSDHTGDVVTVARATGAPVVAVFELAIWLERKGLKNVIGMGIGGTVSVAGLEISMTPAVHTQQRRRGRHDRVSRAAGRLRRADGGRRSRSTLPATPRSSATCG